MKHYERLARRRIGGRKLNKKEAKELLKRSIKEAGFNQTQTKQLNKWVEEYYKHDQISFKHLTLCLEDLKELNNDFFDWCEKNKTLDKNIWGES